MINSGLYGFSDIVSKDMIPSSSTEDIGNVMLFELLMILVMLIMLNLLIAIMNSAYDSVKETAALEVMHDKALIVRDAERFWLPMILARLKIKINEIFPRHLHLLVPTALTKDTTGTDEAQTPRKAFNADGDESKQRPDEEQLELPDANDGVLTQKQMMETWKTVVIGAGVFAKRGKVHAKHVLDNGTLETVAQGVIQTRNSYEKGDVIVCNTEGEQRYCMPSMAFAARYSLVQFHMC